jgi:chemotaxis protein methyltransferase CheR
MSNEIQAIQGVEREFEFTDDDFRFIVKLVKDKVGIKLGDHKRDMIYGRIARRLRALKLKTFKEYCEFLSSGEAGNEVVDFVNAVTTNLTKFFREEHHFEHLREVSIPAAIGANTETKKIRIWSAGCSTGMEPYSIAMVLLTIIKQKNLSNWDIKILATDIDTNVLAKAQSGNYTDHDIENVPVRYREAFIDVDHKAGTAKMSQELKNLISFKQLNLMESLPFKGPFDIIFCRNVVIYFDKPTQKILFNKYADVMRKDSYLYIGHSESLHNISDRFELIGKTTYKKTK